MDQVQACMIRPLYLFDPAVSSERCDHLHAHLLQEGLDGPQVSGDVILTQQVYGVRAPGLVVSSSDQLEEGIAGGLVSLILVSFEALGFDRNYRYSELCCRLATYGPDVVSDDPHDACGIDKDGRGPVFMGQLFNGCCQLLLAAEDHIQLLHVRGEAHLVKRRSGGRAASDVPGVAGAAYGAVHQMKSVREWIEDNPGS